ncbi:MAG: imidazole glycerol phosphate synthase subunit HisH [Spirochaetaceae bacterium]|jgi:glutamine amidotransferase|nr:imidazole glycerol phosphate synthase subunit HisH [Spirochaetaceae bacterium]
MIAVIDYNAGNLKSVETALQFIGADFKICSKPEEIKAASKVIFPGVGHAASAMENLKKNGMDQALREFAATGKAFLGICLGSQILFDHSQEGDTPCLGIVPGDVRQFPKDLGLKIPQIGWNTVDFIDDPLIKGLSKEASFYFVHSYYVDPLDKAHQWGSSNYGIDFCSAVMKDNIRATQFHPEKSGREGLKILKNFLNWEV